MEIIKQWMQRWFLVGAADWETRQTAELTNIGLTRPPQTDQNNNKWDEDDDDDDYEDNYNDDDDDDDDVDDDDDKLTLSVPAFAADRSKHLTFSSFLVDFCRP